MGTYILERGPRLRRGILLAVVVGVPLLFVRPTNDPFNVPKLALLVAGLAIVIALRVTEMLQGSGTEGMRRLLVPAIAISLPLLAAWAFTSYKGWALLGHNGRFQGLLPYLLVVVLGVLLADAFDGRAHQIAWALLWAGAVMGAYALFQVLGWDPYEWILDDRQTSRALSTTGNPNFTGGFLGIALPIGVALAVYDPGRRRLAIGLTVASIAGWIGSKSYGGWAAGLGGLALTLGFILQTRFSFARVLGILAAVGAAVAVAGAVIFSILQPRNEVVPSSIVQRAYAWEAALEMMGESPIVGAGPNVYAFEGVQHRPVHDALKFGYSFADDPHSVPLALLANAGLLGTLGYLAIFGWVVWLGLRVSDVWPLTAGFFGATAAYFVQSLVSIDEISLRLALWASLAGIVVSLLPLPESERKRTKGRSTKRKPARGRPSARPLRGKPVVAATWLLASAVLWWTGQFLIADARVLNARRLFELDHPKEAHEVIAPALAFREDPEYRYEDILGLLRGGVKKGVDGKEHIEAAEASFRALNIPDVQTVAGYANLMHLWARNEPAADRVAEEQYRRAIRLDPLNPLIRVGLSDVLVSSDSYEEALAVLEPMIPLYADPPKDWDSLSDFWGAVAYSRAQLGDREGALKAIGIAVEIDPDDDRATEARKVLEGGSGGS